MAVARRNSRFARWAARAFAGGALCFSAGAAATASGGCEGCAFAGPTRTTTVEVIGGEEGATLVELCDATGKNCYGEHWQGEDVALEERSPAGGFSACDFVEHLVVVTSPNCARVQTTVPAAPADETTFEVTVTLHCTPA